MKLTLASFVLVNTTMMLIKHVTQIQHKTCCSIQTSNGLDGMTTRASCTNKKELNRTQRHITANTHNQPQVLQPLELAFYFALH